jgi:hypothetical protein
MFFFPLLLGTSFPAYILMSFILGIGLLYGHLKIHIADLPILVFLCVVWIAKYLQVGLIVTEVLFRNYSGWLIVYYFYRATMARIKIERLLLLFCISVVIEVVLINTVVSPSYLPNYSDDFKKSTHNTAFMGFYRRPMSIGGNASMSSTILVLMLFYLESSKKNGQILIARKLEIFALITIVLFASGTGFFIYFIYLFYRLHLFSKKRNVFLFISLIGAIVIILNYATVHSNSIISKVSYEYLEFLWDFKIKQVDDVLNELKKSSMMIGGMFTRKNVRTWSDFALLDLFHSLGMSGLIVLFAFSMIKINSINAGTIFVGILGMIHYGAILSMPGQLIFAYSLILNRKNVRYYIS